MYLLLYLLLILVTEVLLCFILVTEVLFYLLLVTEVLFYLNLVTEGGWECHIFGLFGYGLDLIHLNISSDFQNSKSVFPLDFLGALMGPYKVPLGSDWSKW